MNHRLISTAVLAGLPAFTSVAEAKAPSSPPAGTRVVSAKQFDIYAELKESKPFADTYPMLNIYSITVVAHQTGEHGLKRFISRLEAFDANLLDPSMWQVGDFNGDGFEDYRAVSGINNNGCHTWSTRTWLPKRARFTYGEKNNTYIYRCERQADQILLPLKINAKLTTLLMGSAAQLFVS